MSICISRWETPRVTARLQQAVLHQQIDALAVAAAAELFVALRLVQQHEHVIGLLP